MCSNPTLNHPSRVNPAAMAAEATAKLAAAEEESRLKGADEQKEVSGGQDGDGEVTPTGLPKKSENTLNVPEVAGGTKRAKKKDKSRSPATSSISSCTSGSSEDKRKKKERKKRKKRKRPASRDRGSGNVGGQGRDPALGHRAARGVPQAPEEGAGAGSADTVQ